MSVVWLHGAGLSGATWDGFPGLSPDLPGHGSAARARRPSVEGFADALTPQLPDTMHLVGHSLGGMLALELAARLKDRVRSLITIEAVPTVHTSRSAQLTARVALWMFRLLGPGGVARLSGLGQPQEAAAHIKPQIAAMSREGMKDALQAAFAYDGRPRLAEVTAPALVIVGRDNRQTHDGARLMAEGLPQAEFEIMPGGHILHIEAADRLRSRISQFQEAHP